MPLGQAAHSTRLSIFLAAVADEMMRFPANVDSRPLLLFAEHGNERLQRRALVRRQIRRRLQSRSKAHRLVEQPCILRRGQSGPTCIRADRDTLK